ncbi:hypothetical protein L916_14359 [Phytophthora nicotianae]|uniref:Uncharacterized protein n=1 Tax=Phytophthora nicotianae TaxID=4792 RepID=W2IGF1_PHYNI|nr:hypothetical protein L916_14359 [Phytophthora nicotianae]
MVDKHTPVWLERYDQQAETNQGLQRNTSYMSWKRDLTMVSKDEYTAGGFTAAYESPTNNH